MVVTIRVSRDSAQRSSGGERLPWAVYFVKPISGYQHPTANLEGWDITRVYHGSVRKVGANRKSFSNNFTG